MLAPGGKMSRGLAGGGPSPPGRTPVYVLSGSANVYLWVTGRASMLRDQKGARVSPQLRGLLKDMGVR